MNLSNLKALPRTWSLASIVVTSLFFKNILLAAEHTGRMIKIIALLLFVAFKLL